MRKLWTILLMFGLASILIVACGGANGGEPGGAEDEGLGTEGNTVDVNLTEYEIAMPADLQSGPTEFVVTNAGTMTHSFEIEGQGIEEELAAELQPGDIGSLQVDLQPGTYTIYCPVDDHRGQGMELTVTVQ